MGARCPANSRAPLTTDGPPTPTPTPTQKCEKPGDLLCCDTCNLAFHMRCLGLREHEVPDDFRCVCAYVSVCAMMIDAHLIVAC